VEVTFADASGSLGATAANYVVTGTGKGTLGDNPSTAASVSGNTFLLTWNSGEMKDGGDITITYTTMQGRSGGPTVVAATHSGGGIGVAPSVSFSSTPSHPTTQTSANFTFSGADAGTPSSGVDRLECRLDSGSFASCTSPHTLSSLSVAAHTFSIRSVDQAGNQSNVLSYAWTINPPPLPDSATVRSGRTVEVTFAAASGAAGATASNYVLTGTGKGNLANTPNSATLVSGTTYLLTWTSGEMFHGGNITITYMTSSSATHTSGAIGVAPTASFSATPTDPSTQTSADFTFSGTDSGTPSSGIARLECRLDSGNFATCTSPQALTNLGEGSHSFSIRAVDQAGNTSNILTHSWTISISRMLAGNFYHSCGAVAGVPKCWGTNFYGEIGDGTTTDRNSATAISGLGSVVLAISAGYALSCALLATGVKC